MGVDIHRHAAEWDGQVVETPHPIILLGEMVEHRGDAVAAQSYAIGTLGAAGFSPSYGESENIGYAAFLPDGVAAVFVVASPNQRQPFLLAENGVELLRVVADGIESSHNGTDARAGDVVDGDAHLLYHFQHAYLGGSSCTPSSQGYTHTEAVAVFCHAGGREAEQGDNGEKYLCLHVAVMSFSRWKGRHSFSSSMSSCRG